MTDHKPLEWLHSVKDLTSRLIRWRLKLAEYDYKVIYKASKMNCNTDALSRNLVKYETTPEHREPLKEHQGCMFPLKLDDTDDEMIFNPPPRQHGAVNTREAITNEKNIDVLQDAEAGHKS